MRVTSADCEDVRGLKWVPCIGWVAFVLPGARGTFEEVATWVASLRPGEMSTREKRQLLLVALMARLLRYCGCCCCCLRPCVGCIRTCEIEVIFEKLARWSFKNSMPVMDIWRVMALHPLYHIVHKKTGDQGYDPSSSSFFFTRS